MATTYDREIKGSIDLTYKGVTYSDIQVAYITATSEYKGEKKVTNFYTTQPIPEIDIKPLDIRLYPRKGMNEDFETVIKPLMEGQVVHCEGLISKSGKTYAMDLVFDNEQVPSFLKKPLYQGTLDKANAEG